MLEYIKQSHRNQGSGGVYSVSGTDFVKVRERANEIKQGIDFMRSPYMTEKIAPTGELVIEIKYYGLD